MLQVISCDTRGDTHAWVVETVAHDGDEHYSQGFMRQRRCTKCLQVEYIRHVSYDLAEQIDIESLLVSVGLRDGTRPS